MDSKAVIRGFENFLNEYSKDKEAFALEVTVLVKEFVRDRVQNSGVSSEGSPFAPYTPSYAKQRAKQGYQVRKVDYTRTGQLWGNVTAKIESTTETSVTTGFGPRTPENVMKITGPGALKPRKDGVSRGLIIRPSQEELEDAFNIWKEGIVNTFRKQFA